MRESSLSLWFFSFSLWLSHSLGCYLCYLPQIVLRAFRPGFYPTCNLCLPVQHLFADGGCDCLGYFSAGVVVRHVFCEFPPALPVMLSSEISKHPTDPLMRRFPVVWKLLLLHDSLPVLISIPNSCLSFCLLYFVLPPFEEIGLPFWVPGVLSQCSDVVWWKLLSIQMIFWWICGAESGLPILFLHHLEVSPFSFN